MSRFWPLALLLLTGCGSSERTVRHYQKIRFARQETEQQPAVPTPSEPRAAIPGAMPALDAARGMGDLPAEALGDKLPLVWDIPSGWEDHGSSGIRIATFRVAGQECTILSFPGDVGGDEANLRRWLGQLNQSASAETVARLTASAATGQTASGFDIRYYDFSVVLPADAAQSTLAGIIPVGEQTVFVKLTGDANVLAAQKSAFEALCRSIRLRTGVTN